MELPTVYCRRASIQYPHRFGKGSIAAYLTRDKDFTRIILSRSLAPGDLPIPVGAPFWRHKSRRKTDLGHFPKETLLALRDLLNHLFPPEKDVD